MEMAWEETQIVLPMSTPDYIRSAAQIFGLKMILTDRPLEGDSILFEADPWTGIRAVRANWVRQPRIAACLEALPRDIALPERVFLSRKSTRQLSNAVEVEEFLAGHGFVTLYPEDLSAVEQFRLFREVETIVAIHGASLGPLLYRPAHSRLRQLIEILPCGHMTDVYRVMAEQVGCAWIGVRGRLKPEYIRPAYRLDARFDAFSLESFELDIVALAQALERID
jgi:hypothetical protein